MTAHNANQPDSRLVTQSSLLSFFSTEEPATKNVKMKSMYNMFNSVEERNQFKFTEIYLGIM